MMVKLAKGHRLGLFALLLILLQAHWLSGCSFAVLDAANGKRVSATTQQSTITLLSATRDADKIYACIELSNSITQRSELYTLEIPPLSVMREEQDEHGEPEQQGEIERYTINNYYPGCKTLADKVAILNFGKGDVIDLHFDMPEMVYLYQDKEGWALGYMVESSDTHKIDNVNLDVSHLPVMRYSKDKKPYLLLLLPATIPVDMAAIVVGGGAFIVGGVIVYPFFVIGCATNEGACS